MYLRDLYFNTLKTDGTKTVDRNWTKMMIRTEILLRMMD